MDDQSRYRPYIRLLIAVILLLLGAIGAAHAADKEPDIVVIWGDDIGSWNLGPYTQGLMCRTPNIDSIAKIER